MWGGRPCLAVRVRSERSHEQGRSFSGEFKNEGRVDDVASCRGRKNALGMCGGIRSVEGYDVHQINIRSAIGKEGSTCGHLNSA